MGIMGLGDNLESVSALFPAFNDAVTIGGLVEKTFNLLRSTGRNFEILVVNDGSTDQTADVLRQLQIRYDGVLRVIHHPVNRGYGAALRSGFAAACKDLVFYTDGDGQYDPGELTLLLDRLEPRLGLVNGYKIKRHDPLYRVFIGKIYNAFVRALFHIRVRDVDCDFRLMRRSLLARTSLHSETGAICVELLQELESLGCEVANVPVHHYPRVAGRSQFFRLSSVFATLSQLGRLYFRRRASRRSSAAELLDPIQNDHR